MAIQKIGYEGRDEWLKLRRSYIGGSDSAAVLGLNQWASPLSVYADKLQLVPEREDNEAMRQGRDLEAYVAERWAEYTGHKVRRENHILVNDEYPWLSANIDRRVVGLHEGLECKTTSVYNRTDFEGGDVPPYYYVQCQHYMAVTGWDMWHLAILVLNQGFYVFKVERNEEDIRALLEGTKKFWYDHVLAEVPPEPISEDSDLIQQLYPADCEASYVPMHTMVDVFDELNDVKAKVKQYQEEQKTLENKIKAALGEATEGGNDRWKVTWRNVTSRRINSTRLRKESPELYDEYSSESTYRRFLVTEAKE